MMSRTNKKSQQDLLWTSAFHLIDTFVELYLSSVIKPFVSLHEVFYSGLNNVLRKCLDDNQSRIPAWFTANFITYFRTALVLPTLILLAWHHQVLPALIVILVDFGDFLDGVVARYWADVRKKNEQPKKTTMTTLESSSKKDNKKETAKKTTTAAGRSSPTDSDEDSFGAY
jgi:CDP-alcohol phosphatidyltransferase